MKRLFKNKKAQKEEVKETVAIVGLKSIIVEKVHENAIIPTYASNGDSGMDVYALDEMVLMPGFNGIIKTGIKIEIPKHPLHELGYRWECQVRPRSGISARTMLRVANAPGTIDNFYRDEIGIVMTNTADRTNYLQGTDTVLDLKGNTVPLAEVNIEAENMPANSYLIRRGDRIAQLVFKEVVRPAAIIEGKVSNEDSRGGGFGHTDDKPAVIEEVTEAKPVDVKAELYEDGTNGTI